MYWTMQPKKMLFYCIRTSKQFPFFPLKIHMHFRNVVGERQLLCHWYRHNFGQKLLKIPAWNFSDTLLRLTIIPIFTPVDYSISALCVSSVCRPHCVEDSRETGQAQKCKELGCEKAAGGSKVTRSWKRNRETLDFELGSRKTKIIPSWRLKLEDRWKDTKTRMLNFWIMSHEHPGNSRAESLALKINK